jgi:hypothetical protein
MLSVLAVLSLSWKGGGQAAHVGSICSVSGMAGQLRSQQWADGFISCSNC